MWPKAIVGLIDWNLDMQSAIDLPNHVNRNGATELEKDTEVTKRAGRTPTIKARGSYQSSE